MKTLKQLLASQNRPLAVVSPKDSVFHALSVMAKHDVGALLVLEGEQLVGIFSERDLVYRVANDGASALDHVVGDVMTAPAITIDEDTPVMHALSLMTKRRIRHLPVVADTAVIGMISIGDLVKFRIDTIESEAASLRDYIQTA